MWWRETIGGLILAGLCFLPGAAYLLARRSLAGVGETDTDGLGADPAPRADVAPIDPLVDQLDDQPVPPFPLGLQLPGELDDPVG